MVVSFLCSYTTTRATIGGHVIIEPVDGKILKAFSGLDSDMLPLCAIAVEVGDESFDVLNKAKELRAYVIVDESLTDSAAEVISHMQRLYYILRFPGDSAGAGEQWFYDRNAVVFSMLALNNRLGKLRVSMKIVSRETKDPGDTLQMVRKLRQRDALRSRHDVRSSTNVDELSRRARGK